MAAKKVLLPAACVLAGLAIGAFGLSGLYIYGSANGATYRVNRFTGVQQFASSRGWVSQREMMEEAFSTAFGGLRSGVETMARSQ